MYVPYVFLFCISPDMFHTGVTLIILLARDFLLSGEVTAIFCGRQQHCFIALVCVSSNSLGRVFKKNDQF